MCVAIELKHISLMEYLVEKEGKQILSVMNIGLDEPKMEMVPLHRAAMLENEDSLDWILDQGVSVDLAPPPRTRHFICSAAIYDAR